MKKKILLISLLIIIIIVFGGFYIIFNSSNNHTYTLTLNTSGTGSGAVQVSPSGPYNNGDIVVIWANASNGSTFTGFSGNLTGTSSPQTLTINENEAVNAVFTLNSTFILNTVALTLDDIDGNYTLVDEKHMTEPGEFTNTTGDGRIWKYTEHYQSMFMQNATSTGPISANDPKNKIIQSITRLESKEKAELFFDLWTNKQLDEGHLNIPIEKIGDKSSYLSFKTPYTKEIEIDTYQLCFTIEDIVVTIYGGGLTVNQSMFIDFAKIIESNILNSM
ncbi:MAG: hypothetical protein MUO82_02185 [Candidatus Thermoplasmatota archaeon]|nr:hypothetical protein [Candidatus Thermoplasmatota archaeon]